MTFRTPAHARDICGKQAARPITAVTLAAGIAALVGCAAPPGLSAEPGTSAYRCEQGLAFSLRVDGDEAVIDLGASHGRERLGRDAGGATPTQTVWSGPRMRVELGLGASGAEAVLRLPLVPLVARCVRAS